jgi:DNA repair exonuclease SbcCD ATPase subunit
MIKYLRNLFCPEPELSSAERIQLLDHAMHYEHEVERLKKEIISLQEELANKDTALSALNRDFKGLLEQLEVLKQCHEVNKDQFEKYRKSHEQCSMSEAMNPGRVIMKYKDIEHVKSKGGRPKRVKV